MKGSKAGPQVDDDLGERLAHFVEWEIGRDDMRRVFDFGDFVTAFAFMSSVALVAERMGHHPEWSNTYGRVEIRLTTHDMGGLSALDADLAAEIDRLATRRPPTG